MKKGHSFLNFIAPQYKQVLNIVKCYDKDDDNKDNKVTKLFSKQHRE